MTHRKSFFKNWNAVYGVVIVFLIVIIFLMYLFTLYFK